MALTRAKWNMTAARGHSAHEKVRASRMRASCNFSAQTQFMPVADDVERFRIGERKNCNPFGAERGFSFNADGASSCRR